jgi:transposase
MPRKRQIIQLSKIEQSSLTKILTKKETSAREQTRARVLDLLARTEHPKTIANLFEVGIATVYNIQKRFLDEGFEAALYDKPRSGKPPTIKPDEKAKITALACSEAPAGYARWTLRLLADKAVELSYIDSISAMEVGRILKKTLYSRTNKNNGVSER